MGRFLLPFMSNYVFIEKGWYVLFSDRSVDIMNDGVQITVSREDNLYNQMALINKEIERLRALKGNHTEKITELEEKFQKLSRQLQESSP